MRNTDINKAEISPDKYEIIKIDNLAPFEFEEYDLNDPKEFKKYIRRIKNTICRNSFEYKELIKFLRNNLDMNKCSFFENVNNIDSFKIRIEQHHHPFTLEDIILIVVNKRMYYNESLSEEQVGKEVMFLHYCGLVGLIPLSSTIHELVHNNYLFIPINKVYGRVNDFINMYEQFMTPEQLEVLENNINYSKVYNENAHKDVLKRHDIYIDASGAYKIPRYEDIINEMNQKIRYIQDNKDNDYCMKKAFIRV